MEIPKLPDKLRTEEEIIATWKGDIKNPLVSVCCSTFNHAPYIEDAIKGFLIQETDFPIEVWIHDDASHDGTAEILLEYQKAYPRIINLIVQPENIYSKGDSPYAVIDSNLKGKYVALCEGDDYWVDVSKLQKQFDYLEKHSHVVVCSHNAVTVSPNRQEILAYPRLAKRFQRDFPPNEMRKGKAYMLLQNLFVRNVLCDLPPEKKKVVNGDVFISAYLGTLGGSHFHTDIKDSVHIRHEGGIWSSRSTRDRLMAQINTWFWIYSFFVRISDNEAAAAWRRAHLRKTLQVCTSFEVASEALVCLLRLRKIKLLITDAFK